MLTLKISRRFREWNFNEEIINSVLQEMVTYCRLKKKKEMLNRRAAGYIICHNKKSMP